MAASPAFFSSILNVPNSKISNPDLGFLNTSFKVKRKQYSSQFHRISTADTSPSSSPSCNSAAIANSLTLDHDSINDEELKKAESKLGAKVRVAVPLKVYHVPKLPEYDLTGKTGVLKQYVGVHKGKKISANLPYKVEFLADDVPGRDGKPVKFSAHLRDDEFEFLDWFVLNICGFLLSRNDFGVQDLLAHHIVDNVPCISYFGLTWNGFRNIAFAFRILHLEILEISFSQFLRIEEFHNIA